MAIKKIAILALKGSKNGVRDLAEVLGASKQSVYRYLDNNDDNLTKVAALAVFEQHTGLSREEILETTSTELTEQK